MTSKQPSIVSFFGKRKRLGVDESRVNSKKLLLDIDNCQVGFTKTDVHDTEKPVQSNEISNKVTNLQQNEARSSIQVSKKDDVVDKDKKDGNDKEIISKKAKLESIRANLFTRLDPELQANKTASSKVVEKEKTAADIRKEKFRNLLKSSSVKTVATDFLSKLDKELNSKSSKELSLKNAEESEKKQNIEKLVPKVSKFDTIEVDVPRSPHKSSPLFSPVKLRSPAKPANHRFASLAEPATLPLPCGYQKLYEIFQAVDTICSMMMARKQVVTFEELKPGVQELTSKNFTTRHLGQINNVVPSFTFRQEMMKNYGSTSKADKYKLVITPTEQLTPKSIKARKEAFHKALLEKAKDYHEEFLKTLDPPIELNRNELKRWHPNFMVDAIPDIIPQELPQPPDSDRPATASDVLERARQFLSSNSRLQKALEAAAAEPSEEKKPADSISPQIKEKVEARLKDPLKNVSKSLLEKVRARQAAKALDAMRMTPQEEKEIVMYTRLPEIARIVRTYFVNEQKGVVTWENAIEKVQFSYNRSLSRSEVEAHLKLLVQLLPEWLSKLHVRETDHLKMNRLSATQLSSVMNKLDKIVKDKKSKMI